LRVTFGNVVDSIGDLRLKQIVQSPYMKNLTKIDLTSNYIGTISMTLLAPSPLSDLTE